MKNCINMGSIWIWLLLVIFYTRGKSKHYIIETFDEEKKAPTNGYKSLDYGENVPSSSNLDQLVQSIIGKGGDYQDKPINTTAEVIEAKKLITTDLCYSILTAPEGEQPKFTLGGNKTDIVICLPASLIAWKKARGYTAVNEIACQVTNQGVSPVAVNKTFVLPEIATTGNASTPVTVVQERIKSWDALDMKLRDPIQTWSKFTRDQLPSEFDRNFVFASEALQREMENSSLDEFFGKVSFIKDNKYVNKVIYKQALVRALFSRKDTSNDVLSPLELNGGSLFENNITTDLPYFEPNDTEATMNYWREDLLLHVFHAFWHTISPKAYPRNRAAERFVFAHNEFLKRYYIEREMNNMSSISCATGEEFYNTLNGTYEPKLANTTYKKRPINCQLKAETIQILRKARTDLLLKLPILRNDGERFSYALDWPYHGTGHMKCAQECIVGPGYSAMWSSALSARDPIFYQWHCEIQRVWQLWMDMQRNYEKKDMAGNMEILKLSVESEGSPNNTFRTFMENTSLSHKESYMINYHRLNHMKFTIKFYLVNNQQIRKSAIIRIFLGNPIDSTTYRGYSNNSKNIIQMDRFVVRLNGAKYQLVTRHSIESALTMKESGTTLYELGKQINKFKDKSTKKNPAPFCGWPHNLLIPKGGVGGVPFDLVVVVNDVDSKITEGRDKVDHILCGHSNPKVLLDSRPFGFPFDRPWNFTLNEIKSVKIGRVLIYHGAAAVNQSISGIDNVNENGTRTDDKNATSIVLNSGTVLQTTNNASLENMALALVQNARNST